MTDLPRPEIHVQALPETATAPRPMDEMLQMLEKLSAMSERKYILVSYPAANTQTPPSA